MNNFINYPKDSCNVAHKFKNATLITKHSTKQKVNIRINLK